MTWLNEWLKEQIPSYKRALTHVDPRTKDWFLLWADPVPAVTLALIYLLIVTLGPRYMRHREAIHVPSAILFVYNMALVVLSAYMVEEVRPDGIEEEAHPSLCLDCRWNLSQWLQLALSENGGDQRSRTYASDQCPVVLFRF